MDDVLSAEHTAVAHSKDHDRLLRQTPGCIRAVPGVGMALLRPLGRVTTVIQIQQTQGGICFFLSLFEKCYIFVRMSLRNVSDDFEDTAPTLHLEIRIIRSGRVRRKPFAQCFACSSIQIL